MKTAWGIGIHGVVEPVKIVQHLIQEHDWSYMTARAASNKPYIAPLGILTFNI